MNTHSELTTEVRVRAITAEMLGLQLSDVQPESRFVADLGADSLDTVELLMAVEDEYDIEIPDDDAERLVRVSEAAAYVQARLAARATTGPSDHGDFDPARAGDGVALIRYDALSDLQLNYAVATLLGKDIVWVAFADCYGEIDPQDRIAVEPLADYCNDWKQGGPLVGMFQVSFEPQFAFGRVDTWVSRSFVRADGTATHSRNAAHHKQQLRAAMMAIVQQHVGDKVSVPAAFCPR